MAETEENGTEESSIKSFNERVGELLKSVRPEEVVEILQSPSSLLRAASDNNQNQNHANLAGTHAPLTHTHAGQTHTHAALTHAPQTHTHAAQTHAPQTHAPQTHAPKR
jgi:hypothetical protein